ncbi:hypothetical protein [Luteibacter yeojuensis]|uniref:Uncharacterized protein n=1 Tax=Luteibacter yeojuensis TaxID=345309 RepID=A0A0F3KI76_9GAMM|nr:hypothetical protein [Luteibacter yeojuensis]KJV30965.1 hypothetical protein VI08_14580 [Luteibacter yeojuensis]
MFDGLTTTKSADDYVACVTQAYAKRWPGTSATTFPDGHRVLIASAKDGPAQGEMSVANAVDGKSLVTLRGAGLSLRTQHDMSVLMQQCR